MHKDIRITTWKMYASNEGQIGMSYSHFVIVILFGVQGTLENL